ncbi:MAG TPA: ATP synthase subunit I [Bryobacteraceae bacterium]|nr:ATP synthase subunit I [Bryobacteraceae bacterium]
MIASLAAGIVLGLMFYGGLWMTVRSLMKTRHPVALSFSSYLLRALVAVTGFALAARGGWRNALACLAGFAVGRVIVSRTVRCT